MRWAIKIGIAIILIFFFAPIIPVVYTKSALLPWENTCIGVLAHAPNILVFASPSFILFRNGVAIIPASSSPIQFESFHPTVDLECA
jgi:hypothetical protein